MPKIFTLGGGVLRRVLAGLGVILLAFALVLVMLAITAPSPREVPAWTLGAEAPLARGEVSAAVVRGEGRERLVVVGGFTGVGGTTDAVTVYDPVEAAGTTGHRCPQPGIT